MLNRNVRAHAAQSIITAYAITYNKPLAIPLERKLSGHPTAGNPLVSSY